MADSDSSFLLRESDPLLREETFAPMMTRRSGDGAGEEASQEASSSSSSSNLSYSTHRQWSSGVGEYVLEDEAEVGGENDIGVSPPPRSTSAGIYRKAAVAIGMSIIALGVIAVVAWSHAVGKTIGRTRLKVIESQSSVNKGGEI